MVVIFIGTMFAGCDSWSWNYNNTRPPITTGTNPTDKNNDPNFSESNEDLVDDDDMIDESAIYEFLDGVKFAYDGKAHKIETLNDTRFEAVYDRVSQYLTTNNTIDSATFAENNSELGVDATYISRVVWLYNYVNQYKSLARIILTKVAETYGYGIGTDYVQNNNLYGQLYYDQYEIEDNGDYTTYKNAINAGVYEVSNTITTDNPYNGLGNAIFDDGSNYVDFNTQSYIDFELSIDVPVSAYYFAMNLNDEGSYFVVTTENPYYDPSNIVNQPTIPNPDYDPSNPDSSQTIANPEYIEGHILGMSEISFLGIVDSDGNVTYEIGSTQIEEPDANDFIQNYISTYENYLALKLLETHIKTNNVYEGDYINVTDLDLLALYEDWSMQIGHLGFSENFYDLNDNEYNTLDEFTQVVYDNVVGQDTLDFDADAGIYSRDIENNIAQIVNDSLYAKVTNDYDYFVFDYENGQDFFVNVYNIEWKDYTVEEIFDTSSPTEEENANSNNLISLYADDPLDYPSGPPIDSGEGYEDKIVYLPDEIVYSIVVMLKPDYEPVVMQSIMLMMLAPYSELDVELSFRYVKNGEEKIFSPIDYSLKDEASEDGDYVVNGTFDGHLPQYDGEELSLETADNYLFALEDYNTPELNTIRNQEILLEQFENNLASNYAQSLNASLGANRYAYSQELQTYYYNESGENCDYVEMNFHTTALTEDEALTRLRLVLYVFYFDTLSGLQEDANSTV